MAPTLEQTKPDTLWKPEKKKAKNDLWKKMLFSEKWIMKLIKSTSCENNNGQKRDFYVIIKSTVHNRHCLKLHQALLIPIMLHTLWAGNLIEKCSFMESNIPMTNMTISVWKSIFLRIKKKNRDHKKKIQDTQRNTSRYKLKNAPELLFGEC